MQWYEELFKNFAKNYEKETYTHGTVQEVDFIEREIEFKKSAKVLDIGCGTGRHAIELARRGYKVTGVDLSEAQLKRARENALSAGVNVDFMRADARELEFYDDFDLVMIICEGAFSLMETDEMNFRILENAARALKKPGKLIFTSLNALFPLHNCVDSFINSNSPGAKNEGSKFDLSTLRMYSTVNFVDDDGIRKTISTNERFYMPSELTWMLKSLGFSNIDVFGCVTGEFQRGRQVSQNEFELLVCANY